MPDPYSSDYTGTPITPENREAFRQADDRQQARQQDAYMAREMRKAGAAPGRKSRKSVRQ